MTLVVSIPHPDALVMASDSRKTTTYTRVNPITLEPTGEVSVDFSTTTKLFTIKGIGCITMWGDLTRAEHRINSFLHRIASIVKGPEEIAERLISFLQFEVDAEHGSDIGFHVGGYSEEGKQKLYHVFWGLERGLQVDVNNNPPDYRKHDHSHNTALYNGRNDLADVLFRFLTTLEKEVNIIDWITKHSLSKSVQFVDTLIRFIGQTAPDVGGAVSIAIIFPGNRIVIIRNDTELPMHSTAIDKALYHVL